MEQKKAELLANLAAQGRKTWEAYFGDTPPDPTWVAHFAGQFYEDLTREEVNDLARRVREGGNSPAAEEGDSGS